MHIKSGADGRVRARSTARIAGRPGLGAGGQRQRVRWPSGYTDLHRRRLLPATAASPTVGDEKTCTITNDDVAPTLTVNKVVVNDDGGTRFNL